jgi:hypothetical protein
VVATIFVTVMVAISCMEVGIGRATEGVPKTAGTGASGLRQIQGGWQASADGSVGAFGGAATYVSMRAGLNDPIVGMAATPDGRGYWLVASDGGVFAVGDARFYGSLGSIRLNRPIVGMAATPDGRGYWLVASDGGVFALGDAGFHGSEGGSTTPRTIVGIEATPDGRGYVMDAVNGAIFAFGDAPTFNPTNGETLPQPIVGMATMDGTTVTSTHSSTNNTVPTTTTTTSTVPTTTTTPNGVGTTALTNSVISGTNSDGWEESDTASISGANAPSAGGTVSYAVYSDDTCSALIASAGTANVSNGSVPPSKGVNLKAGGTYYWQAHYSGDSSDGASSTACTPLTIFMSSVDTMKYSMDSNSESCDPNGSDVCSPTSQIGEIVASAATLGSNFITVDSQMDFPAYEAEWAATIHAAGKHVWWRVHPNFWEGDWGVSIPADCSPGSQLQYTGVTPGSPQAGEGGSPCLEQYLSTESSWIADNSNMFEPGDVLDANPEPENSPYWDDDYGAGWTYEGNDAVAVPDFNQFLVDVTATANTALASAGINGVITGVRSLSESFAETNGGLEQSTIDTLGYLTIDSYPDQNFVPCNGGSGSCDQTYATDAASAWSTQLGHIVSDQQAARGNSNPVPILIGEAGYSNCDPTGGSDCAEISGQQQANVLADEYNAFGSYDIQGLNYWVGPGQQGDGGNTEIMQPSGSSWNIECGGSVLSAYFKSQSTTIATPSC